MAEQNDKQDKPENQEKTVGFNIRFTPVDNSDQPVLTNITRLNAAPGMAFVDFGFIEPMALSQISRLIQTGGKVPETLTCKLAVRVAMGFDTLAALHQQIGKVLGSLQAQRAQGSAPAKLDVKH